MGGRRGFQEPSPLAWRNAEEDFGEPSNAHKSLTGGGGEGRVKGNYRISSAKRVHFNMVSTGLYGPHAPHVTTRTDQTPGLWVEMSGAEPEICRQSTATVPAFRASPVPSRVGASGGPESGNAKLWSRGGARFHGCYTANLNQEQFS